jgi:hypothetical protein
MESSRLQVLDADIITLYSVGFKDGHRVRPENFTRNSPLSFDRVALTICGDRQTTYAGEMVRVFKRLTGDEFDGRVRRG